MSHDLKVQDEPGLVRKGGNPGVISNVDYEAFQAYQARRQKLMTDQERIQNLEQKVDDLGSKLDLILNHIKGAN